MKKLIMMAVAALALGVFAAEADQASNLQPSTLNLQPPPPRTKSPLPSANKYFP